MVARNHIFFIWFGLTTLVLLGFVYFLLGGKDNSVREEKREVVARKRIAAAKKTKIGDKNKKKYRIGSSESKKICPDLARGFSDEGDESLSALAKAVMKELQDSLDGNDLSAVRKSIAKFSLPESRGGLGGNVPKSLKLAAIDALRWFDSRGLLAGGGEAGAGGDSSDVSLIDFIADADSDVSESALDALEDALNDFDMSDYARSELLKTILKAVNDTDRIESMISSLDNMRNSVKADTIISLMETGTDNVKAIMKEELEFYTDMDITTVNGVRQWKTDNDEFDAEFYGGQSDK